MKFLAATIALAFAATAHADHAFTLTNRCPGAVNPVVADTRCGFSPRCGDASSFTGAQPGSVAPGTSKVVNIPNNWVGRIFNQNGACGAKGDGCTMGEFNLDSGDFFTPQSYDISNIQGFTQSMQISAAGCATVTCTNANCGCANAFPIGDTTGCGNDSPVRACGAGNIAFNTHLCSPPQLCSALKYFTKIYAFNAHLGSLVFNIGNSWVVSAFDSLGIEAACAMVATFFYNTEIALDKDPVCNMFRVVRL
ncbi:hypothetical protein D9758_016014 [Tetrapyrgos nigripes]|uniref:Thaumatin-like protein n=1 Tax=Tetrapyrgos nigripes TaxID=182062 RepID=A0A8H5CJX9_9AGAR|nr:hypothetical protein D9758_016014 [Tetrapyrgos nigripes]